MKTLKALGLFFIFTIAVSIYVSGCSPAETTTGKLAYAQKDWEKAVVELAKGLAIDKSDAEAWYMLGYSQTELGRFEDAGKSFAQAKSLSSEYNNLILSYWIDKFNGGISEFNLGVKALGKKDNDNANKNFTSAIKYFSAASAIIPDSISTYQLIADSYNYLGQNDKALAIYKGILDKSKSKEDAIMIAKLMYQNGIKARQADDYEKSIEIFNQIVTIKYLPTDNIYYESSLFNIAIANYQIASKKVADGKGKAEYEGNLNETVKYMEQYVASTKNKDLLKDAYEILYNAYDGLGNKVKSEEALNKKNSLK